MSQRVSSSDLQALHGEAVELASIPDLVSRYAYYAAVVVLVVWFLVDKDAVERTEVCWCLCSCCVGLACYNDPSLTVARNRIPIYLVR
jgi:hypothetical protein